MASKKSPKKKPTSGDVELDLDISGQEEFNKLWLTKALQLVRGERRKQYGHIIHNWRRWRLMLTAILGFSPSYDQMAMILISMKMCRQLTNPKDDNWIDIPGYVQCRQDIDLFEEEHGPESATT